jgi:nucleoside phosphorylase
MLDEAHRDPETRIRPTDDNVYALGKIGQHYVVIASHPAGRIGTAPANEVATNLLSSFERIRFLLLVGIGGGVPSYGPPGDRREILLGDVVVGIPSRGYGGVVPYDFGAHIDGGRFRFSGHSDSPPSELLKAINKLRSNHEMEPGTQVPRFLSEMRAKIAERERASFQHPGVDQLYLATYSHPDEIRSCQKCCDSTKLLRQKCRSNDNPEIHYGNIASANQLMLDGVRRNELQQKFDVLCFEMEAAGLNKYPCLTIRGISDYADSHKNKICQKYAAATAAAYAKELLNVTPIPGDSEAVVANDVESEGRPAC